MSNVDEVLTIEQAAERLNMSARWVRRMVAERRIPFHKFGRSVRIVASDLAVYLETTKVEPISRAQVWADLRRAA